MLRLGKGRGGTNATSASVLTVSFFLFPEKFRSKLVETEMKIVINSEDLSPTSRWRYHIVVGAASSTLVCFSLKRVFALHGFSTECVGVNCFTQPVV